MKTKVTYKIQDEAGNNWNAKNRAFYVYNHSATIYRSFIAAAKAASKFKLYKANGKYVKVSICPVEEYFI